MQQTSAELGAGQVDLAVGLVSGAAGCRIGLWWWSFPAAVVPALDRWRLGSGFQANALLVVALVAGGAGFTIPARYGIRIAPIGSMVYYTLAQNRSCLPP